ncbi:MAG: outer membrane protein [Paracoccaceae bacterium]|jgi:outer membrane protein
MNWKTSIIFLLTFATSESLLAQEELSLPQIISTALQSNFDIAIAKNNTTTASNQATKAQAGYYPSVNLNGNASYSNNNTSLKFAGGLPDVQVDGAQNTNLGANIGFNYVLFNGFGRVHSYQNLIGNQRLTEVQAQVIAENMVLDIVNRYLDMQQSALDLFAAISNMQISKDRLNRATIGNRNGAKSKLDVLSAQVDLNNDSLSVLNLETSFNKQRAALNVFMGKAPDNLFSISKTIEVPADLNIEEIESLALQNNSSILLAQVSQTLSTNQVETTKGGRLPTLTANGAYGYNTAQNGAGIVLSQSTLGFNGGLTLSMPIFNGNQLNTAMANADLTNQNSELKLAKAKLNIRNQLYAAELDSRLITLTLKAQEENVALTQLALQRAQANYNNGQISFNDLRVAQLSVLIAKNSVNQAKINLVKLYYTVSRLGGGLLTN